MSKEHSLLNQISSKCILRKIFLFAFKDTKSLFKFMKYDKKLIKNLEINIKDSFEYKTDIKIDMNLKETTLFLPTYVIVTKINEFILYLIYIILFYTKVKFNVKNLNENYDIKKKNFVDIMDNYFLIPYLVFIIISIIMVYIYDFFINRFFN